VEAEVEVVVPVEVVALVELEAALVADVAVRTGSVALGKPAYINLKLSCSRTNCVPVILLLRRQLEESVAVRNVTPTQPYGIARL
jgi:hypothetical protein